MAAVFLDTNYFIDIFQRKPESDVIDTLEGCVLYISPLSVHIYCYVYKIKIPNAYLGDQLKKVVCVELNKEILNKSIVGPTTELEDNIQLHSAAIGGCDYFLTSDKNLLKMKFFGKVAILEKLLVASQD